MPSAVAEPGACERRAGGCRHDEGARRLGDPFRHADDCGLRDRRRRGKGKTPAPDPFVSSRDQLFTGKGRLLIQLE